MKFTPTSLPDVILVEPSFFGDERGFFMETYREQLFLNSGISASFVQDNHSGSRQGTLRGMHYQLRQAQGKLVRVIAGEIFDVAVDIRRSSPNFGTWAGASLSNQNRLQMYIPPGFAHGFYVLSDWAEVVYKATDYYAPEWERTILWNDSHLNIHWPLLPGLAPVLSGRDLQGQPFNLAEVYD